MVKTNDDENENMNLDEENLSFNETKYNQNSMINLSKYKKENSNIINESKIKTNTSENKFYISSEINKGPWTPHEDKLLIEYVKKYGPKKWNNCAEFLKNRTSKQCREHWKNCLDPKIKKGEWTPEEDLLLMVFYSKCKGSWRELIHYFNDRTENSIKNRFFSELRKIASNDPCKKEKKRSSKINLKNLLKYLEQGISEAKKNFMIINKMTEEQLNEHIKKIEIKILNKKKDKKRKKLQNYSNKYNLLGKKREKKSEEKNNKIDKQKIINNYPDNDNDILRNEKTKNISSVENPKNEKNNNQTQIHNHNNNNINDTNQEDDEDMNNININNFLEINNQFDNIMDSSFINYELIDECNEDTEEKENIQENIEQKNIKRSSYDLIKLILSNNSDIFPNEGLLSLGKM